MSCVVLGIAVQVDKDLMLLTSLWPRGLSRATALTVGVCLFSASVGLLPVDLVAFIGSTVTSVFFIFHAVSHRSSLLIHSIKIFFSSARSGLLPALVVVIHAAVFFSNSFVVQEDHILLFAALSLLLVIAFSPKDTRTKPSNTRQKLLL